VPRFQCKHCGRTFSSQTFSTDYYAKRKIDYRRLEELLSSSMSVRALSRTFRCSCGSIINRSDRLSRQSIAAHAQLRPLARRQEDVCIDGFVSFDRSQYFPNNITISITAASRYVLAYTHASLRRCGRMRPSQKRRQEELYAGIEFETKALERSFIELLDELRREREPKLNKPLVIITDEKIEYERALIRHSLFLDQTKARRTAHLTVNSQLPRTVANPLFASNYLDREIRKDQAAHRRETACFCRNAANGLARLSCYLGYHNYCKRYAIKASQAESTTHAELAGIPPEAVTKIRHSLFKRRAFLSLLKLDPLDAKLWRKGFSTPGTVKPPYLPAFASG